MCDPKRRGRQEGKTHGPPAHMRRAGRTVLSKEECLIGFNDPWDSVRMKVPLIGSPRVGFTYGGGLEGEVLGGRPLIPFERAVAVCPY